MADDLAYAMNGLSINSPSGPNPFFVTHFPQFQFNSERTLQNNFKALAKSNNWSSRNPKKMYRSTASGEQHTIAEWKSICFVEIFENLYGAEATKLANWQRLCRDVGLPIEVSISKCKRVCTEVFFSGLLAVQET